MTTLRRDLPPLKKIDVFYTSKQNDKFVKNSPGIWKAEKLMHLVLDDEHAQLHEDFQQPSMADLLEVHTRDYVEGVLDFIYPNGHMNKQSSTLEAILWQNGSFLAAVKHAVKNKSIAFSPTSGFHHAGKGYGGAFCTFNALMIAAKKYIREHDKMVLIIDGDAHWGDGCIDCDVDGVRYISTSRYLNPEEFIDKALLSIAHHHGLVLYQAGADCHKDDTYGAGNYSTLQMCRRDEEIFKFCKERKLPIVWNLAGGYGTPELSDTIRLHLNTWDAAVRVYCSDAAATSLP